MGCFHPKSQHNYIFYSRVRMYQTWTVVHGVDMKRLTIKCVCITFDIANKNHDLFTFTELIDNQQSLFNLS